MGVLAGPRLRALTRTGLAPRSQLVRVVLAGAVFLAAWGITHVWFYPQHAHGDVPLYQSYGQAVRDGQVPYRDFALEYPPGALPTFVLPALPGSTYETWFEWLMAACGVGCIVLVAASRPPRLALPFLAVSPLLAGSLIRTHFDLWPALLVAAALAALLHDRHRLGWGLLAAAFAAKLFAAVLVPLAALWTFRRAGRRELARSLAVSIAVVAAIAVPFAVAAPDGLRASVQGQISRPLQIETLTASYLMTFAHPVIRSSHGAKSLPEHDGLAAATTVVLLAVLLALWAGFARGAAEPERLKRYSAACVCAFVCLGKVLSPQFLIWLVPLVPLVRGRRGLAATAALVAALVNTQVWFPGRYFKDYAWDAQLSLAWLVFVRNLTLVGLLAVLAAPAALPAFLARRGRRTLVTSPAASSTASDR
jgi:hypothetical protein